MRTKGPIRPIWQAAIDRYYRELEEGGMKLTPMIEKDLWEIASPNVLIDEIQGMMSQESSITKAGATLLPQLEPVILGFGDFAAIVALSSGMDGRAAALLWGSIRLILRFARPVLPELIALLHELRAALPKGRLSEQDLPLPGPLEAALLDIYTELIVFYAYTIIFFRNNPNVPMKRDLWFTFNSRSEKVISNLRAYSRRVGELADKMRLSKQMQSGETVQAIKDQQKLMVTDNGKPCLMIPYGVNLRFYGRKRKFVS